MTAATHRRSECDRSWRIRVGSRPINVGFPLVQYPIQSSFKRKEESLLPLNMIVLGIVQVARFRKRFWSTTCRTHGFHMAGPRRPAVCGTISHDIANAMRSISKWNKGHLTWAIQWEPFQRLRATRVEATNWSPSGPLVVDPFGTAGPASRFLFPKLL